MPSEYAKTLGARLRAIRTQQGLSLHGVEEKSRGRWKAVVVGSYERGDRSVTVQKLAELAEFYGVPVSELLPGDAAPTPIASAPKLVIARTVKGKGIGYMENRMEWHYLPMSEPQYQQAIADIDSRYEAV